MGISKPFRFRVDEPTNLTEVGCAEISSQVMFSLDRPLLVNPSDTLELSNGQLTLFRNGHKIHLDGQWKTINR